MTDPNPIDGSRCADQVVAAMDYAPGLRNRRFRVLQIETTTTVATRSWDVATPKLFLPGSGVEDRSLARNRKCEAHGRYSCSPCAQEGA